MCFSTVGQAANGAGRYVRQRLFNKDRKDTKDVHTPHPSLNDARSVGAGAELLCLLLNYSPARKRRMCRLRCFQRGSNANAHIVCYQRGNNCADARKFRDKYSDGIVD